jgi:hypothetical protein
LLLIVGTEGLGMAPFVLRHVVRPDLLAAFFARDWLVNCMIFPGISGALWLPVRLPVPQADVPVEMVLALHQGAEWAALEFADALGLLGLGSFTLLGGFAFPFFFRVRVRRVGPVLFPVHFFKFIIQCPVSLV